MAHNIDIAQKLSDLMYELETKRQSTVTRFYYTYSNHSFRATGFKLMSTTAYFKFNI